MIGTGLGNRSPGSAHREARKQRWRIAGRSFLFVALLIATALLTRRNIATFAAALHQALGYEPLLLGAVITACAVYLLRRAVTRRKHEKDLQWLAKILLEAGYSMDAARSGAEALAKAQSTAYGAILLDLILPDMVGWDVLHCIRGEGPNRETPVIVVSVVPENHMARTFPVADYLAKPISPEALINAIRKAALGHGPSRTPEKILVIDNDLTTLKVANAALHAHGYQAVCHASGQGGLDAFSRDEFAAVVLDLSMPEMDAFEFLDRLRRLTPDQKVPVIVWTNRDVTAADRLRLKSSAHSIALKGQLGINAILNELKRHVPTAPRPLECGAQVET